MSEKKAFRRLLGYLAGALMSVAIIIFCIDPFYHYHDAWFGLPVVLENAVYQTPGAARNFEYDSVIIGSSMTENFHAKWFDEAMGWNTLKLSYSAASTNDLKAILEQVFSREESPKNIVLDINDYQLTVDPEAMYVKRPEYLYDYNIFTDLSYIYNQDVFLTAVKRVTDKVMGRQSNLDDAYTWEAEEYFGVDKALGAERGLRAELEQSIKTKPTIEICDANLDNILPFIETHPETTFYVFYPPYSMLYWEREILIGRLEDILAVYGRSMERLFEYDNVKVFYFQNEKELISNLENYRDSAHFSPEYNKYICDCIAIGKRQIDKECYQEQLADMYEYAISFEYSILWE